MIGSAEFKGHQFSMIDGSAKKRRLRFAVVTKAQKPSFDLHEVAAAPRQIERTKKIVERVWRPSKAVCFIPHRRRCSARLARSATNAVLGAAAGAGVAGLAGSSHSILQLGRAFCRAAFDVG